MRIIIKGTKNIDEYKRVRRALERYGEEHGAEVMKWEWGTTTADGVPVKIGI